MSPLPSRLALGIAVTALLAACTVIPPPAPEPQRLVATPTPTPAPSLPAAPAEAPLPSSPEATAQQIAADALGVAPDAITVVSMEAVDWSDASLGCPQPDYAYAQVITPGYKAIVEVDGQQYAVHMDANGNGLVCPPPKAP